MTQRTLTQHPLITAMKRAGDSTRRQASYIAQHTNYGDNADGIALTMARLTDAMVDDWTHRSVLQDRQVLNDRFAKDKAGANERRALRVSITDLLIRFPREYRVQLIDQLAAGNGAEEAHNLQITADRQLALLLAGIRANVEPVAAVS